MAQVGADHHQGVGGPHPLESVGDVAGLGGTRDQGQDRDGPQHREQEGKLHLQGVLLSVGPLPDPYAWSVRQGANAVGVHRMSPQWRLERVGLGQRQAGELGAKTGQGFYKFKKNRPIKAGHLAITPHIDSDHIIIGSSLFYGVLQ